MGDTSEHDTVKPESTKPYVYHGSKWPHDNWEDRIFGAIFLVTVGIVFLLNTTGIIAWSIWINVIKFWPVFIIMAGVGIILGFSRITKAVGSLINYFLFIGILALAFISTRTDLADNFGFILPHTFFSSPMSNNNSTTSETFDIMVEEYPEATSRTINLEVDAGKLVVTDNEEAYLFRSASTYSGKFGVPSLAKELSADELALGFKTESSGWNIFNRVTSEHTITLGAPEVESTLVIKMGAGEGRVTLDELILKSLQADTGAGELRIDVEGDSVPEDLNLKVGAGSIELKLPENIGYRLNYKVGVGSLEINRNSNGSIGGNGTIQSENYTTAVRTIDISAEVGVGSLKINH